MKKMKPYKGYTATVEFDADEMVLHGRVENIRDVISFQAVSVDDLQSAFEEAIDDYLDLCSERGEQPEKPFSGKFVLRLDADLHREIALRSARERKSLNAWIVDVVAAALGVSTTRAGTRKSLNS
jgi:predicted HicB family RNase H-like nuclease